MTRWESCTSDSGISLTGSKCIAGAAASIALLQFDAALVNSALHDLADKAITDTVKPDLPLLSILLKKGLFERVAGGLQSQLLKCLSASPQTPLMVFAQSSSPVDTMLNVTDARSILLPATISLLVSKGYYAQAAALCAYHTHLHPAFASFESGMQQLLPYLNSHQEIGKSDSSFCCMPESWPLPTTLFTVQNLLPKLLATATERMTTDGYNHFF